MKSEQDSYTRAFSHMCNRLLCLAIGMLTECKPLFLLGHLLRTCVVRIRGTNYMRKYHVTNNSIFLEKENV